MKKGQLGQLLCDCLSHRISGWIEVKYTVLELSIGSMCQWKIPDTMQIHLGRIHERYEK